MSKPKHIKAGAPILASAAKIPKSESVPDFYELKPAWRLSQLEMCDPYGWHEIQKDKLIEIHGKLAGFEGRTWKEILVESAYASHSIKVYKICKDARDRLARMGLDDIDDIISLRLSSRERIWGIPHSGALTLLWWDPEHKVYPTAPRNT